MWIYAGTPPPKSIVIPHAPYVRLPNGNFSSAMMCENSDKDAGNSPSSSESRRTLCRDVARHLKNCGINFVRGWFQWNFFQKEILRNSEQVFDFPLDDFVQAMNDEGIKIIAALGNGYYRFLPEHIDVDDSREYVTRLTEASREIVRHYSGKIYMWQLENEPNWWLEHYWIGWRKGLIWFKRDLSATILSELQRVVREEDGNTLTMVNLEADTAKVFFRTFSKYCDILGLDYYPNYIRSDPIDASGIRSIAREVRRMVGNSVVISETGYPSGPRLLGFSETKQAGYVDAVTRESYASDDIQGLGMWRLSDTYWHSFPLQENSFGLLARTGSPKKAWHEYVDQISLLK